MANEGPITKIYQIQVLGFEESKAVFDRMSAELAKLKKQKQDLDKTLSSTVDAGKVELMTKKQQELTLTIIEQTKKVKELENQTRVLQSAETEQVSGIAKARTAYLELVKAYKEAKANSEAMEAQFGAESVEAKEAAAAFVLYEDELRKINALRKGNIADAKVTTPTPTDIPFTHNLNTDGTVKQPELIAGTTALNEYDKAQQAVANSAVAMGESVTVAGQEVKATQPTFTAVVGSLDQYTGSLRQNITAQIENAQAIAANKAAQKEITESIKESGGATQVQIERLAALKEEAIILEQSNKSLTTTIRNQAREFVSATGSIEESRAKVNQLQQAYAQLSDAERAQPFGQAIKDEIDVLEPKLKELEAQIGLFQRNVGNYPSNFTGAFKVLDNELDTLKGKLVQGNFSGAAFDDLTRKTAVLEQVTEKLNTTFKTTTQEQTAYKEAARQVSAEFGTESAVFQNFSKEVGAGNAKLKETDVALNLASGGGAKATGVFKSLFGALRNIANIVPGLGMSGLILLLIAPLQALATSIQNYFTSASEGKEKIKSLNEVQLKSIEIFSKEKGELEGLASVARDHAASLSSRKEALQELIALNPQYLRGLTLENISTAEGTKAIDAYVAALQRKAEVQAATDLNTEAIKGVQSLKEERIALQDLSKSGKVYYNDLSEAQQKFIDKSSFGGLRTSIGSFVGATLNQKDFARIFENIDAEIKKGETKVKVSADIFKQKFENAFTDPGTTKGILQKLQEQVKVLTDKQPFLLTDGEIKANVAQVKKLQDQINALLGNNKADKLNVDEQNRLKVIEATLKQELAIENSRFNEIEKTHAASYDEEIFHLKIIESVNVNALNSKIAIFNKQKKLNADEIATRSEFQSQISSIELQTSQKIQEIEKKRFADQNKDLQASLDANILQAKQAQQKVLDDPGASNVERARANLEFIDTEIIAYKQYYTQLLELNDNYNSDELQKVRDHISALTVERNRGLNNDLAAQEKDLQVQGDREITGINISFQKQRTAILSNEKLTYDQKNSFIERLTSANNITILSKELETLNAQLKIKFQLLLQGLASEEEYNKLRLTAAAKNAELEAAIATDSNKKTKVLITDLKSFAANNLIKLFHFDANTDVAKKQAEVLQETLSTAYSTAQTAMTDFYNSEAAQIERSRKNNEKALQFQFDQLKARATSQAEQASLDKQFQAAKDRNDREAFEKNKKIQREQAKINLAVQLSNLAVIAFSPNPANIATLGIAGTIMYAIQAALAIANYALNVGRINSAQFAQGGEVPKRGGKFGGKQHSQGGTKFNYQNEQYEAEVDELAIIRTRNAPARNKVFQIMGTHEQIASQLNVLGGGIEFAPGAKLKRFAEGGFLGSSLQAPVFVASSNSSTGNSTNGISKDQFDTLISRIDTMNAETSKRIDRMQVVQVTSTVTKAQAKQVQQRAIGTIG